jgi:hypothetical protein
MSMKRREFITLLGSAAAYPATGWGQEAKLPTIPRIGCLVFGAAAVSGSRVEVLGAALRELGYVEGKNIVMETMWAETVDELPGLAAESQAPPARNLWKQVERGGGRADELRGRPR